MDTPVDTPTHSTCYSLFLCLFPCPPNPPFPRSLAASLYRSLSVYLSVPFSTCFPRSFALLRTHSRARFLSQLLEYSVWLVADTWLSLIEEVLPRGGWGLLDILDWASAGTALLLLMYVLYLLCIDRAGVSVLYLLSIDHACQQACVSDVSVSDISASIT